MKHEWKPLKGVKVEIKTNLGSVSFTGITDSEGKAIVANLSPGEYWLSADLLGIGAAYHCFHVAQHPTAKAKRVMKYDRGESRARGAAGCRVHHQYPTGNRRDVFVESHSSSNRLNREYRVCGLRMRSPAEYFAGTSDEHGGFEFDSIPNGTYVLHIEDRTTGRAYDPTDLLIKVRADGTRTAVVLSRQEPGGTNSSDASLTPSWK